MDLHVERQCISGMKAGDGSKFLMLFDAYFADLYKYVARRIKDVNEVERIVRLSFLDALGQIQRTPEEVGFGVWLYGLSKPRTWDYLAANSMPEMQGLIAMQEGEDVGRDEFLKRAEKMMGKLSLEEREIVRLKFFEQVTDGDVSTVLELEEGSVGTKIYRVLKRAHFLLFGESDERQGVYFGELSGFFERLRSVEHIDVPEVFKLSLKADLSNRISRRDFAVEAETVEPEEEPAGQPVNTPFEVKFEASAGEHVGSSDPAKVFTEAVREMREAEAIAVEKREKVYDFLDRWKLVLTGVPILLFLAIFAWVLVKIIDYTGVVERGYATACDIEVQLDGEFSDGEIRRINKGVSDRLCGHFNVASLQIGKAEDGALNVSVDVPDWMLEYRFVEKEYNRVDYWRIKKYERTPDSNEESGQV